MPRWSAPELLRARARPRGERVDAGAPERFVCVDVPDAGEPALIEDRRLDGASGWRALGEAAAREALLERLGADPHREVRLELPRLEEQPRAEPPDIAVGDVRSVV